MKKTLLPIALLLLAVTARGADDTPFRIKPLREVQSTDLIEVKGDWLKCPKRILAPLRVSADTPSDRLFVKAYFYDAAKNLVHTYKAPCPTWTNTAKGLESVALPSMLDNGRDIDVFFALPEDLEAKKWKTVLVVFGTQGDAVGRCKPAGTGDGLEFPEKAFTKISQ